MKEKRYVTAEQRRLDDETLNFVCRQAQEAFLNPSISNVEKDLALSEALKVIQKVSENKAIYYAKHGEGRKARGINIIRKEI